MGIIGNISGYFREYYEFGHGGPGHGKIERAFAMFSPKFPVHFQSRFNKMLNDKERRLVWENLSY